MYNDDDELDNPGGATNGCAISVFGVISFIIVILMFVKGFSYVADRVYPLTTMIASICIPIGILVGLITLAIRPIRWISAMAFALTGAISGFSLWVWCLIVVMLLWGPFWMVVGYMMLGLGVIPMAFFASLFKGEWAAFGTVILFGVITLVLRVAGNAVGKWWMKTSAEDRQRADAREYQKGAAIPPPYNPHTTDV